MPRSGRRKQIGRPKRRTKKENLKKKNEQSNDSNSSKVLLDHSYFSARPAESCKSSLDTQWQPQTPLCSYRGNFENCSCIVHEDNDQSAQIEDSTATVDSDGFSADEYFLVYGTSAQQYQPDDDLALAALTLQNLRKDILDNKNKINEITALGFEFLKSTSGVHIVQFYESDTVEVKLCVTVNSDLTPTIAVHGKKLPSSHPAYKNIVKISIYEDLLIVLRKVCEYFVCHGNFEEEFIDCFTGKGNAYLDRHQRAGNGPTIRSNACEILTIGFRCPACMKYRVSLRNRVKRTKDQRADSVCNVSSSRPNSSMTFEQLANKTNLQRGKIKSLVAQNKQLRERIKSIEECEENASASEINDLIEECKPEMNVLRTVGSAALAPLRGNTKRMSDSDRYNLVNTSLPQKKSRRASDIV